ncbi:MAG TPA: CoA transferase, partial [Acidimicrobiales bacterium]
MPPAGLEVCVGGSSPAMAWAASLLRDLGARTRLAPEAAPGLTAAGAQVTVPDSNDAAADWAESGAMWLTGVADGPPLMPQGLGASAARGALLAFELLSAIAGERVQVPGHRLLGERAAAAGLRREGPWSPSRTSRLLPTRDGLMGLSLARPDDVELVPALVEGDSSSDVWDVVLGWAARRPAEEAVARARLLGLPACVVGEADGAASWFRTTTFVPDGLGATGPPLVVDLSALWAGPLCAHLLGLAGARVIKVESSRRPDGARRGPAAFYRLLHGGHECVAFDFTSPRDRERLRRLLEAADVVIESSRPRAMTQLGIDPEAILSAADNKTWISITAYGRTGPAADWVGFGDDTAAAAGLVVVDPRTGTTVPCGDALADPLTGAHAAVTALASLLGGGSRLVALALADVVAATLVDVVAGAAAPQAEPPQIRTCPRSPWPATGFGGKFIILGADIGLEELVDVRVADGRITAVGPGLKVGGDEVIEAGGGALVPGLHDHHIHLYALAAALRSVPCGPPDVRDRRALATAIRGTVAPSWVRGVGYHDSVAGPLDRWVLDEIEPRRPVRIQHRSGALWMVNSVGADLLGLDTATQDGIERTRDGRATGRLWRLDGWLRDRIGSEAVDLAAIGRLLAGFGITGVTDATPDLSDDAVAALTAGCLPLDVQLLGARHGGPRKILLPDHDLPGFDILVEQVRDARREQRAVAVHCVTREALVLTLTALDEVGSVPGDRIEHGAVVPPELVDQMRRLGVRVVTQPGFVADRGDDYLAEVEPDDRDHLYPYASLLAAGIRTVPSSDAPFGDPDPWRILAAARDRRTAEGQILGPHERVEAATALAGILSPLDDPGGTPRKVERGVPADLCLLHVPLAQALADPSHEHVRLTIRAGAGGDTSV